MKIICDKAHKSVIVRVPGTCGEWIQTLEGDRECLVSLPIDKFTVLRISFKEPSAALSSQGHLMEKSLQAFHKISDFLNLCETIKQQIHFEVLERLEIGKGMASSTADIVAIMAGVSALTGVELTKEELLKLACDIEPSDGIMFSGLALVDHLNGKMLEKYDYEASLRILMLKPDNTFVTDSMRSHSDYLKGLERKSEKPLNLFREGVAEHSLSKMGQASTCSLLENENILEKPYLRELIDLSEKYNCYGVVGGHSGTLCGLLLNEAKTDLNLLLEAITQQSLGNYYSANEVVNTYYKGIEICID